jgi:hypothetical protein
LACLANRISGRQQELAGNREGGRQADNQSTGFVLLIDSESKETVAKLTSRQKTDEMYKIVVEKL